jgi:hypothetical protein
MGGTHIAPLIYACKSDAIYVLTIERQRIRAMRDESTIHTFVSRSTTTIPPLEVSATWSYMEDSKNSKAKTKIEALALLKARHRMRCQATDSPKLLPQSQATVVF